MTTTPTTIRLILRRTPGRRAFLQFLVDHGPTSQFTGLTPWPTVDSICQLRVAGYVTDRAIRRQRDRRGRTSSTMQFRITNAGRAWLAAAPVR